ncbi:MAG: DUF3866 family protein [Chitinophagales bacterium]
MIRLRKGVVTRIVRERPTFQELRVLVEGAERPAAAYPALSGPVAPGDVVTLNTTATALGLGSGGYDFVVAVDGERSADPPAPGHIMKLRYTPLQVKVLSVEEEESPHHAALDQCESLEGLPVVVGSLHSQLVPAVLGVRRFAGAGCRVVYLMTDGGALPLAWSETVDRLRREGLLAATITVGQAFGGDFEAINKFSGLLAAKVAAGADVAVVTMGPGIVGTGTRWGHTGLEAGEWVNAVAALGGSPIAVPRLSFGDARERHRGVSHHFLTALGRVARAPAVVPVPVMGGGRDEEVWDTLTEAFAAPGCPPHELRRVDASFLAEALAATGWEPTSMGRGFAADPAPFLGAAAAGRVAAEAWLAGRGQAGGASRSSNC